MLSIDRIDWTKLISFSSVGIRIADYSDIRKAVIDMFKDVYGDDIDLSTATADGIYVNNYCLIINNILQSLKSTYSNLDVSQAQGKYLEMLSALTNVYRRPATKSTASLKVTLDNAYQSDYVAPTLQFVDNAGTTWTANASDVQQTNFVLQPGKEQTINVTCDESGPVKAPIGWINKTVAMEVSIDVIQEKAATVGLVAETDAELRSRRASSTGTQANSVLEALVGELYKISGIMDVKVYNNVSGSSITAKDGTNIDNHDVYILLREQDPTLIPDSLIGTTIYENMTPGIRTVGGNYSFVYTISFMDSDINLSVAQVARWQAVQPIDPAFKIVLTPLDYFAESTCDKVAEAVIAFANGLKIGEDLMTRDVDDIASLADPLFRNRHTFRIAEIKVGSTVKSLTDILHDSLDQCFDYTSYSYEKVGDDYELTIGE